MGTLIKSEVFDRGDSTYLIDIVRGQDGVEFIRLKRSDHNGSSMISRTLGFDAYVLSRIDAVWKAKPKVVRWSTMNPRLKRISVEDRGEELCWTHVEIAPNVL